MARGWNASGAEDLERISIDPLTRTQIELELAEHQVVLEEPDQFFDALSFAISLQMAWERMKDASKPAVTRARLNAALDAARDLAIKLGELDGNSISLLHEVIPLGIATLEGVHMREIWQALAEAVQLAEEYPQRGALPNQGRLDLAVQVAEALQTYLGVEPTTTKSGLYDSVLTIVLEHSGGPSEGTHALVARALAKWKALTAEERKSVFPWKPSNWVEKSANQMG